MKLIFRVSSLTVMEKDSLRAIVSVNVCEAVFLTGIRVIEGKKGVLFVTMPARKTVHGEYQDIFFAASREMRDDLSAVVLAAYAENKGGK